MNHLTKLLTKLQKTERKKSAKAISRRLVDCHLLLECLEDRRLLAGVIPNDPGFPQQWELHNTGQTSRATSLGSDLGFGIA